MKVFIAVVFVLTMFVGVNHAVITQSAGLSAFWITASLAGVWIIPDLLD